jgi:hypothetical protein
MVYDRDGAPINTTLCDDHGVCADEHHGIFEGIETTLAIWAPANTSETPRNFSLRAGTEEIRYEHTELPSPIRLIDLKIDHRSDLHISGSSDQSIDMVSLVIKSGQTIRWASVDEPGALSVHDNKIEVNVPRSALDGCKGSCEGELQIGHVWRDDDDVMSVSQVQQKVL